MEFQFLWLTAIIVLPLIASAAIPFIPDKAVDVARSLLWRSLN